MLGLTATPPSTLTRSRSGSSTSSSATRSSASASRRWSARATSAPFAELAWLTTPTPTENEWLAAQGERFAELTAALTDPAYGSTGFFAWLDRRFAQMQRDDDPEQVAAALRMVHAGRGAAAGARLTETPPAHPDGRRLGAADRGMGQHLRRPAATTTSSGPGPRGAAVRRLQLTRRGIRRGRSPVDRVAGPQRGQDPRAHPDRARSEHLNLGDRLRMLVLCDHDGRRGHPPGGPQGACGRRAGRLGAARARAPRGPLPTCSLLRHRYDGGGLGPRRCTGAGGVRRTRGPGRAATAGAGPLDQPRLGPVGDPVLRGRPRRVGGTRGLLGEGWDARAITDWSTSPPRPPTPPSCRPGAGRCATTRAGRRKVALTWSVVCVSEDHPKGGNDWDRFVRKHEGFYGVDARGRRGLRRRPRGHRLLPVRRRRAVGHFDERQRRGWWLRSEQRPDVREAWAVGHAVRRHRRAHRPGHTPASRIRRARSGPPSCCTATTSTCATAGPRPGAARAGGGSRCSRWRSRSCSTSPRRCVGGRGRHDPRHPDHRRRRPRAPARRGPGPAAEIWSRSPSAVADALHERGLSPRGAEAVRRRRRRRSGGAAARWPG